MAIESWLVDPTWSWSSTDGSDPQERWASSNSLPPAGSRSAASTPATTSGNPAYDRFLQRMQQLHTSKNHDYAKPGSPYSNFEIAAELSAGFTDPMDRVFATLIGVKLARLQELTSGKRPNHESILDTRRDLANYACLWGSYFDHVPVSEREEGTGPDQPAAGVVRGPRG